MRCLQPQFLRIGFFLCCVSIESGMSSKKFSPKRGLLKWLSLFRRYLSVTYFWPVTAWHLSGPLGI